MKRRKIELVIGLKKTLRFLHLSDNHLCLADKRDNERKQTLAIARSRGFDGSSPGKTLRFLEEALDYGKANCDLLLHTGDLIDFVSYPNLEALKKYLSVMDTVFAAGNHEFSQYVGEAWEDEAYKMQSFDLVQRQVGNNIDFFARKIGGVNLVAIDNSYYLFAPRHMELLKREVAKGLPVMLLFHNPLYTDELYDEMMVRRKRECAYLVGTPDGKLACYDNLRRRQQQPDAPTLAFCDYVRREPTIQAVFAGHLHFDYETQLTPHLTQYITGGGFCDCASEVEIK